MTDFTTDIDDSTGGDFIGQNDASGDGSYVLVKVPTHGTDTFYYTGSTFTMTSFLRIGAVPNDDPTTEHGWDLAKLVVGFVDDTRTRPITVNGVTQAEVKGSATIESLVDDSNGATLVTDLQDRLKAFYGTGNASADQTLRIYESKRLHYRGGWRDHSDGNRISTTLGDKVEIIRGNYKMVVLGRRPASEVNDPVDSLSNSTTTWDTSGGHIMDWRLTPGAHTEVSWVEGDYGTWKVIEETVKGDLDETYHGIVTETYLGPSVTTTTGWEGGGGNDDPVARVASFTAAAGADAAAVAAAANAAAADKADTTIPKIYRDSPILNRDNPDVTDRMWAKNVYDYDGSSDCPIEYIEEKTYAKKMKEEIRVTSGDGLIETEIHATKFYEDIYVDYHSTTHHGVDARELWMGHFGEMFIGACESFKIGNFLDTRIGFKILETNLSILPLTQLNISSAVYTFEFAPTKVDIFKGKSKYSFDLCTEVVEVNPGKKSDVSGIWKRVALAIFLG